MPTKKSTQKQPIGMKANKANSVNIESPKAEVGNEYVKVNPELLGTKLNPLFYGNNEFYVRPFTIGEIRKISQITNENSEAIVNEVLSNAIKIDGDMTYEDIISMDKLSFVFLCRTLTYPDPNFVINFKCDNEIEVENDKKEKIKKSCGYPNKLHFDMEDVDINYIKEDLSEKDFVFKTSEGITIKYKMPTIKDEEIIEIQKEKMEHILKKEDEKNELDEDILALACIIEDIDDDSLMKNVKGIYDYLNNLKPMDFIKLKKKFDKLHCGVDTEIKATCEECGGTVLVPVMFSAEFFLPDYND